MPQELVKPFPSARFTSLTSIRRDIWLHVVPISISKYMLAPKLPQYHKYLLCISKSILAHLPSPLSSLQLMGLPPPNYSSYNAAVLTILGSCYFRYALSTLYLWIVSLLSVYFLYLIYNKSLALNCTMEW